MKQTRQQDCDFYTVENTLRGMRERVNTIRGNVGEVAIINPTFIRQTFHRDYWQPEYQLLKLKYGLGCYPDTPCGIIVGQFCADGEKYCIDRANLIGIADAETTAYANKLEQKWLRARKRALKASV